MITNSAAHIIPDKTKPKETLLERTAQKIADWLKLSNQDLLKIDPQEFKKVFGVRLKDLPEAEKGIIGLAHFATLRCHAGMLLSRLFERTITAEEQDNYLKLYSTALKCLSQRQATLMSAVSPYYSPLEAYNEDQHTLFHGYGKLKEWVLRDMPKRFPVLVSLCKDDLTGRISSDMYKLRKTSGSFFKGHIQSLARPEASGPNIQQGEMTAINPALLAELQAKQPGICSLVTNKHWLKQFIEFASYLRLIAPDISSAQIKSGKTPLQYATKNNLLVELQPGILLCPLSQSFRRFILIETEGSKVKGAIQIKIPGQIPIKTQLYPEGFDTAKYLADNKIPIMSPIAFITLPAGEYCLYGKKRTFRGSGPGIEISRHVEGHRASYYKPPHNSQAKEIISAAQDILREVHKCGYLMDEEKNGHNFHLIDRRNGSPRIMLVNDCEGFRKVPKGDMGTQLRSKEILDIVWEFF